MEGNPCCLCTTINFRRERLVKHLAQGCNHYRTISAIRESNLWINDPTPLPTELSRLSILESLMSHAFVSHKDVWLIISIHIICLEAVALVFFVKFMLPTDGKAFPKGTSKIFYGLVYKSGYVKHCNYLLFKDNA